MEATFPIEILQAALETAATRDEAENIEIETEIESASGALVLCEPRLIRQAFVDLLSIALNCVREGESILLESRVEGSNALVRIATRGEFLPPEDLETFFEIGGQRTLLREGGDFGLGPALARRILELFDGRLSVRNGEERGIVLEALLPLAD
jgi:signal transduction histidine kinase